MKYNSKTYLLYLIERAMNFRFFFLLCITLQYIFPADSINIALYGKPFVKYVGSLPLTTINNETVVDTSRINPNNLVDKNYFTLLVFPGLEKTNIGSSFGIEMTDSVSVSSVRIINLGNTNLSPNTRIRAFSIYGSRDTILWSKLYQVTENKDSATHLASIASRDRWKYLKIVIDSMSSTYFTVISELEVYKVGNLAAIFTKPLTSPFHFFVSQNYPNPFNPQTSIRFGLASSGLTSLTLYDVLGRKIATLVNEVMDAGDHVRDFSAAQLNSGVYFYTLRSGNFTETKKMMILK